VINRPEVAIIAPNKIVERPVFHGDSIRRARLMNRSISCDHRVVDGWDAANYIQARAASSLTNDDADASATERRRRSA